MADYIQQSVGPVSLPMNTAMPLVTSVPDTTGRLSHREGSGVVSMAGGRNRRRCCCCDCCNTAKYLISYNANIAVPDGGTPGEIALAFVIDGGAEYSTIAKVTPTVAGAYFNVSASKNIVLPNNCCCSDISVQNVSTTNQTIDVDNLNVTITPA